MKNLSALCVALLGSALSAQTSTNTLEFRHGGSVSVSHRHLDLAEGTTLNQLMATGEEASRFRQFFNEGGFLGRIRGALELSNATELAGNELDAGSYKLSFRIDDDQMWYLVILSPDDEEVFSSLLDVEKAKTARFNRLVIQPMATDNATGEGRLEVHFGKLSASVPLAILDVEAGSPGENTNQDAPTSNHKLELGNGTAIESSYRQLTLGGGQNLKTLLSKSPQGEGMRQFYNTQYLPSILHGKLTFSTPMSIGGHALPPGEHEFTFRIDNDLVWHVVVDEETDLALDVESGSDLADRLTVLPVAASGNADGGYLAIRYGPLAAKVDFGMAAGTDSRPSNGDK